jgi:hypothetical protein
VHKAITLGHNGGKPQAKCVISHHFVSKHDFSDNTCFGLAQNMLILLE